MTDPAPRRPPRESVGDHVDFSGGTFHDKVVGTVVQQGPAVPVALNAVPAPPGGFTGREAELGRVADQLNPRAGTGSEAVVVSALSGMGGVGKTALALKAAEVALESGWFCAHLYVDLHGYTPDVPPVTGSAALDTLLRQVGTDLERIPPGARERAAFYRSALQALTQDDEQRRPVLVVADNAHHLDQVLPLVPGPGGHRLLATSRDHLVIDGHSPLTLDTLPPGEAVDLLKALLGADDPRAADTEGLTELAQRCGYLPLALKISAALLSRTPTMIAARLIGRLADLDGFQHGRDDLAAVFAASLDHLPPDRVRVFALLGSNPGSDISTLAAAFLTGLKPEEVEEVLEDLAAAHLITTPAPGRWAMHDLLADHARTLTPEPGTTAEEKADPREQALDRLLDFYLVIADAADDHLRALKSDTPHEFFSDRAAALRWLDAERDNLVATVRTAHHTGRTSIAIYLPFRLGTYLSLRRRFDIAVEVNTLARETAQQIGEAGSEAPACTNLGNALRAVRRFEEAIDAHVRARDLFQQNGIAHGEAIAWTNLGNTLRAVRRFEEAIDAHVRARDVLQQIGEAGSEASACTNLGNALWEVRRFEEAIDAHVRARDLFQQNGKAHGEAMAWTNLGSALVGVGSFEEAIDAHTRALAYYQQAGDTHGEAKTWLGIGGAFNVARRKREARHAVAQAVAGFRESGDSYRLDVAEQALGDLQRPWWRFWER